MPSASSFALSRLRSSAAHAPRATPSARTSSEFVQHETAGARQICRHLQLPQESPRRQRAVAVQGHDRERTAAQALAVPASCRRRDTTDYCVAGPRRGVRAARRQAGGHLRRRIRRRARAIRAARRSTPTCDAPRRAARLRQPRRSATAISCSTPGLDATPGFQFAIGNDHDWIIIETMPTNPDSCFFDRGTDVLMHFNNTIPAHDGAFIEGASHEPRRISVSKPTPTASRSSPGTCPAVR